jgi:hypothetical protein
MKVTSVSEILFPVSIPETNGSWVGENNKKLGALFRCMELSNCGPNQQKGAHIIPDLLGFCVHPD